MLPWRFDFEMQRGYYGFGRVCFKWDLREVLRDSLKGCIRGFHEDDDSSAMKCAPDVLIFHAGADYGVAEIKQGLFKRNKLFAVAEDDARRLCKCICNCRGENMPDHAGADGSIAARIDKDEAAGGAALGVEVGKDGAVGYDFDDANGVEVERNSGLRIERLDIDLVTNRADARGYGLAG